MSNQMAEEEKKAFFKELYELDNITVDDDIEDSSNISAILRNSKPPSSKPGPKPTNSRLRGPHAKSHMVESTQLSSFPRASVSFPGIEASGKVAVPAARRSSPLIISPTSIANAPPKPNAGMDQVLETRRRNECITEAPNRKRKRVQSFDVLPGSQQIFRDLAFYFFPNNDVAPARRLRIRKAMEYGALWVKEWRDSVTHVIVDKGLCYKDLLTFLKLDSLPPNIVLVNEVYPADCIMFKCLVNPKQIHYQVQGYEETLPQQHLPKQASPSDSSLQLKNTEQGLHLQQTPSRTEASENSDSVTPAVKAQDSIKAIFEPDHVLETPPTAPRIPPDDLSMAIEEAQAIKDLPIEFDDDDDDAPANGNVEGTEGSEEENSEDERRPKPRKKGSKQKSWQQGFMCMSRNDGTGRVENPNARTIEVLQQMTDYYEQTKDHWRLTAYRKVIGQLRKMNHKITTAAEAREIPWVGERLADKIEEIVWTNRLRRLDNATSEPNDEAFRTFTKIYGVGHAQASKWIDQGHRTIGDLVEKASLTKNQKIGIAHFDDFETRIPRQEMQKHDQYVRETVAKIDPSLQFTIGGSYRRGAASSGDVDFIVTKAGCPIEILRTMMLETVIPTLFRKGYLRVGLATTDKDDGSKWHGAATLPGHTVWRRIDFLFVPWDELGAALIYFTGNDIFNRSIRLLASKKGLRLNQRGLWKDVIRGPKGQRMTNGTLLEGKDEKKIFELLGVPWRPPEHRIC